jgi:regulator of protease activity HflC (stomatin/prohibitin superfamily)
MVAKADGEFLKAKIEADAYYQQQQQIAKAISAEAKAEAAGIRAMNNALAEKGGKVMVKLEMAKALKGKKIIVLPTNSGNGLNLQTMDMNELLKLKGVQSVTPKKDASAN